MRRYYLSLLFLLLTPTLAWGQGANPPPISSPPPANARYTIVQSPLAGKWQFLLDRYAGYVYQIVKTNDGGVAWEKTRVIGLPEKRSGNRPHYQIFTSGLAARHTFLLDTNTGQSWVLISQTTPDGSTLIVWEMFGK